MTAYKTLIATMAADLRTVLKGSFDANQYATGILETEPLEETLHYEVRGFHTRSGNPATFRWDIPAELRDAQ